MARSAHALGKLDRILLAVYLIALASLLVFPVGGPEFQILGIEADKWMHAALFGGLAALVRWNLRAARHPFFVAIGAAFAVAAGAEVVQSMLTYRSAEMGDLLAGFLGAFLGAISMSRILSYPAPERLIGLLVAILGLMVGTFFALADVIGVGENSTFGTLQLAGTALGVLITAGGAVVRSRGLRDAFRSR